MGFSRTNLICLFALLALVDHAEGATREKQTRARSRRPRITTPAVPNSGNNPQSRTTPPPQRNPQQPYIAPYPPPQPPYPPVVAPQYRQPPRQQNQLGQPAFVPPHLRNQDDFTGVKNWYYSTGATFGAENLTRSNPGIYECEKCKKTIEEPRWALQLQGAAGWGPVKRNNFSFTTHYRYTQNLRTNDEQVRRFGAWFGSFKASDFLFPTKDMLRSHELVTEIRYSRRPWQFGMHAMLEFERVGSSSVFLGEENEIADSVRNIEQIVPWVQWRKPGAYIGTLYSPMRTEINKEDPRTSFTSWSATTAGRGLFVSMIQDNLIYLPRISSTVGATLSWLNKKAASVQNDSTLLGVKASMDFPIAYNIRTQPYLKYEVENYILERISMAQTEDAKISLAERSDEIIGSGAQIYFDWSKSIRLNFTLSYESRQSSLSDFSSSRLVYQGGILYSWPLSRTVLKRIDRFSESLSSEEN